MILSSSCVCRLFDARKAVNNGSAVIDIIDCFYFKDFMTFL